MKYYNRIYIESNGKRPCPKHIISSVLDILEMKVDEDDLKKLNSGDFNFTGFNELLVKVSSLSLEPEIKTLMVKYIVWYYTAIDMDVNDKSRRLEYRNLIKYVNTIY